MAHSFSAVSLIGVLIIGLIVGGAGVYLGTHPSAPSNSTVTETATITSSTTVTSTLSSSSSSGSGPTMSQFLSALSNSTSIKLTLKSFDFGKGSLSAWVVNNGTSPIALLPSDVIYNKTTSGATIGFSYVDPTVTRVGVYAYIPVGSQLYISAVPVQPPLQGQNATLQVVNVVFTFSYGTSG